MQSHDREAIFAPRGGVAARIIYAKLATDWDDSLTKYISKNQIHQALEIKHFFAIKLTHTRSD